MQSHLELGGFLTVILPLLEVYRVNGAWMDLMELPAILNQQNKRTKLLTIDAAICLLSHPIR
jgi:hypothetical protein